MKFAIIGDYIIDEFINYTSIKISPESPCPVVKLKSSKILPGGAANVANSCNKIGLDFSFIFCTEINKNQNIHKCSNNTFNYTRKDFIQSHKKRHCVDNIQFFREDKETISNKFETDLNLIDNILNNLANEQIDFIIISDYQKGALTEQELSYLIRKAKERNIKSILDTKISKPSFLMDCFLLKPNLNEFCKLTGFAPKNLNHEELVREAEPYAKSLMHKYNISNIVLTMSQYGSVWFNKESTVKNKSNKESSVVDIVGAGDTVMVALAYIYNSGISMSRKDILRFATELAEISISKYGTNPITLDELSSAFNKIKKNKVGFTNGCFDILHPGHISLLKQAKERCNKLIVGLNSDLSIKKLKGSNRPINKQEDRLKVLENIKWVDEVIIFDEQTPLNLIKLIKPDLLVKGSDYEINEVVGTDFVKSYGGIVFLANLIETDSTTDRIENYEKRKKTT